MQKSIQLIELFYNAFFLTKIRNDDQMLQKTSVRFFWREFLMIQNPAITRFKVSKAKTWKTKWSARLSKKQKKEN